LLISYVGTVITNHITQGGIGYAKYMVLGRFTLILRD
jgi:hypothetical protein